MAIDLKGKDLLVTIKDNGKGFEQSKTATRKSFGLLGMRERALALGGELEIISAVGKGTLVSVSIPLIQSEKLK